MAAGKAIGSPGFGLPPKNWPDSKAGELAASVAHRIRNPLAVINSAAQFCLANFKLESEAKKYIEIILRNSNEIEKTIKGLIDLARL